MTASSAEKPSYAPAGLTTLKVKGHGIFTCRYNPLSGRLDVMRRTIQPTPNPPRPKRLMRFAWRLGAGYTIIADQATVVANYFESLFLGSAAGAPRRRGGGEPVG